MSGIVPARSIGTSRRNALWTMTGVDEVFTQRLLELATGKYIGSAYTDVAADTPFVGRHHCDEQVCEAGGVELTVEIVMMTSRCSILALGTSSSYHG